MHRLGVFHAFAITCLAVLTCRSNLNDREVRQEGLLFRRAMVGSGERVSSKRLDIIVNMLVQNVCPE